MEVHAQTEVVRREVEHLREVLNKANTDFVQKEEELQEAIAKIT